MKVSPSAGSVEAFTAVALALKLVDKEIRADLNKTVRDTLNPIWRAEITRTAIDHPLFAPVLANGARVAAGNPAKAVAGSSRRPLSGGMVPRDHARGVEFGVFNRTTRTTTYSRKSKSGGTHQVTRRASVQMPSKTRTGHVVYPAWAEMAPRMVSLWVQTIARRLHETLERK